MRKIRLIQSFTIIMILLLYSLGSTRTVDAAAKTLSRPAGTKAVSTSYNSITVSWRKVTGASGYQIYRSVSISGTYSLIKTTKSLNYNNTGLITGNTYYYKIRAYKTSGKTKRYGSFSMIVSARAIPPVPSSVKIKKYTYNSITVGWSSVTGASGYKVYRASSLTGTYALITTTSAKSYKNTGLQSGKTYYYKVRAYKKVGIYNVFGNLTSVVSATTPIVKVSSVELSKTKVTITMGDTVTLTTTVSPSSAANKSVTWKSSDNTIVTVNQKGNLTPVSTGTAIITVTTKDQNKTAQCKVTVKDATINGIDVSKWQKTIDWTAVKNAGIKFAMIRSSYGSKSVDPMFETNYTSAKANGLAVGAYHYSYATTTAKALTEVKFFISTLKGKQFEYPVCVDIEDSSQNNLDQDTLTDIALVYLSKLKNAGYYPMIYMNKTWFMNKLDDSKLTAYDHWLAQWGSSITYTGDVGIWQHTSSGTVDGINGNVDLDTSFIDYKAKIKSLHLNGF